MLSKWCVLVSTLVLCVGVPSQAPTQEAILKRVTFIPQWQPQAQFAGYYVAREKGFYRKHGIDLTILRGGPEMEPSRLLLEGQADFGTIFLSTAVQKRAHGLRLVNIAQLVQCSSLMLVAKKSSEIYLPKDMNGKQIGLWGPEFQVQARAFFRKYQLKVKLLQQAATVNLFLRGGVDVASAMWYNEYHMILNSGLDPDELTTFFFFDHGMNFPEDGIYCMVGTFESDPELCCRFVRASLEGWRYAFEHQQEALDIVMKYVDEANVATDRIHQQWMLERMRDIMMNHGCGTSEPVSPADQSGAATNAPTRTFGVLRETDYQRVVEEIKNAGLIDRIPNFSEFYKGCVVIHEK